MSTDDPTEHETRIETAKAALRTAGSAAATRRAAPLVRNLLPAIESAKAAGATIDEIIEALRNSGFDIKPKTFKTNLYRARKKNKTMGGRKEGSVTIRGPVTAGPTETNAPDKPMTPAEALRHRMAESRKIRDPLAPAPSPKKWHWDPLDRPVIEFIDKEDEKK